MNFEPFHDQFLNFCDGGGDNVGVGFNPPYTGGPFPLIATARIIRTVPYDTTNDDFVPVLDTASERQKDQNQRRALYTRELLSNCAIAHR
jgi:hypothetical protein